MGIKCAPLVSVLSLVALTACQSIPDDAKHELARPIDCSSAERDLAILEGEKVGIGRMIASGVRSIAPAGAATALLTGDTIDRAKVATGAYNRELDEKIFQIRRQCSLPVAAVTAEGLYRVDRSRLGFAAVKPGVDFGRYDQLLLLPVHVTFKDSRDSRRLSEQAVDDLRRYFHEAVARELQAKGGYRLVADPGPSVLLVRPALLDVEITAPPEPTSARSRVFISEAGAVTLVAELRDSQDGELLARAVDRRKVGASGGGFYESTRVGNLADLRRVYAFWASTLRDRLDRAHELSAARREPLPDVAAPPATPR